MGELEEFVSRNARYPIELGVVKRMLGEMIVESCELCVIEYSEVLV